MRLRINARGCQWVLILAALVLLAAPAGANEDPVTEGAVTDDAVTDDFAKDVEAVCEGLVGALAGGTVKFNMRLRTEIARAEGLDRSNAYTERIRLGYETNTFHGFTGYIEFEQTQSLNYDLYNAAGLNRQGRRTVIADPEDEEVNQAYLQFAPEGYDTVLKGGRQRIILDDARFVGNVGWRQLEQTYTAFMAHNTSVEDLELTYAYINDIHRIFGPDSGRDLRSDSNLFNVGYHTPVGKVVGFAYLLRVPEAKVLGSNTYGARLTGSQDLNDDMAVAYEGSFAHQEDGQSNPVDYKAQYYRVSGTLKKKGLGGIGAGYEDLGSDSGRIGFATPLATLHKFNGWADIFLVTPATGLEDWFVTLDAELPWGCKGKVVWHTFHQDQGSSKFGSEWDALIAKKFNDNVSGLLKFAYFKSTKGLQRVYPDTVRYWLETTITF